MERRTHILLKSFVVVFGVAIALGVAEDSFAQGRRLFACAEEGECIYEADCPQPEHGELCECDATGDYDTATGYATCNIWSYCAAAAPCENFADGGTVVPAAEHNMKLASLLEQPDHFSPVSYWGEFMTLNEVVSNDLAPAGFEASAFLAIRTLACSNVS